MSGPVIEALAAGFEAMAAGHREAKSLALAEAWESAAHDVRERLGPAVDRLQQKAWADGRMVGREEWARELVVADVVTFHGTPDFREIGETGIALRMTAEQAEYLQHSLSDLLCWVAGFNAALGSDDLDRRPMGVETVRTLRETITKAQRAVEKAKQP